MMQSDMWLILLVLTVESHCSSLSFDPDDYLEVYPDPTVQQGNTTPLYFSLIQDLTGPSISSINGTVAGVKVAPTIILVYSKATPSTTHLVMER
jgi:hypothetical protein